MGRRSRSTGAVLALLVAAASACERSPERSKADAGRGAAPERAAAAVTPQAPAARDVVAGAPSVPSDLADGAARPPEPALAPQEPATAAPSLGVTWGSSVSSASGDGTSRAPGPPAEPPAAAAPARSAAPPRSAPPAREPPPAAARAPDRTPPEAPPGLVAEALPDRSVALRWDPARDRGGVVRYEVLEGDAVVATSAVARARVKGAPAGRETCWTVVAIDAAGNRSPPAARACATPPDVTPPTSPVSPVAAARGEAEIELSWGEATDDAGVKGYRVLRGGAVVASGERPGARETGLRAATEHCYAVVAFDAAGNVSAPAGPACATTPDLTPPTAPGALHVKAIGEDRVELRWGAATDAVGVASYEVRRGAELRLREAGLVAVDAGLRPYTTYCYAVVAVDAAGNRSAPGGTECARTLDVTPPSTPRGLVVRPSAHARLEARWVPSADNAGVAGYELLRDGKVALAAAGPAADVFGLAPATEYCFAVRAHDAAGNRSPDAPVVCGRTLAPEQPVPPRNVVVERRASAVQVTWEAAGRPDVVFRVYEDKRPVGSTRFLTYSVPRADAKRRCYSVGAVDEAGHESPASEEACVAGGAETSAR